MIAFQEQEGAVSIKYLLSPSDFSDDIIVTSSSELLRDGIITLSNNSAIDVDIDQAKYEDTNFIKFSGKLKLKGEKKYLNFTRVQDLGKGIDKSYFSPYNRVINIQIDDEKYIIMHQDDIYGILG